MNEANEQQSVPPQIRELLAQRSTYEDWLEKLDRVGDEYRREVAERVRADYRSRLAGVSEELESHRHELEASLQARRRRMQELTDAFDGQSAELEEAELRHKVGEYDDGTWEAKRTNYTSALEEIELELDGARGAVEELEDVLARLGASDLTEVLEKNGVPWVGSSDQRSRGSSASAVEPPREARPEERADTGTKHAAGEEAADAADVGAAKAQPTAPAAGRDEKAAKPKDSPREARETPIASSGKGRREEDRAAAESTAATAAARPEGREASGESAEAADDYLDELEFLESLSLDDPDSFDAVSRMLEDEEDR